MRHFLQCSRMLRQLLEVRIDEGWKRTDALSFRPIVGREAEESGDRLIFGQRRLRSKKSVIRALTIRNIGLTIIVNTVYQGMSIAEPKRARP
ncbi:hypothetical protein KCU76_g92, partial [Aureobasidium melanogenum]